MFIPLVFKPVGCGGVLVEIVLQKMCVYLSTYLCMFVYVNPCEQKFEMVQQPYVNKSVLNVSTTRLYSEAASCRCAKIWVCRLLELLSFIGITQLKNNGTGLTGYQDAYSLKLKGMCPVLMQMKMQGFGERIYRGKHKRKTIRDSSV